MCGIPECGARMGVDMKNGVIMGGPGVKGVLKWGTLSIGSFFRGGVSRGGRIEGWSPISSSS